MAKIIILIPDDPKLPTVIETKGFKGEGCTNLTKGLEQALGAVTSEAKTDEYYEKPLDQEQQQFQ